MRESDYKVGPMALPALKEAYDLIRAAPALPPARDPSFERVRQTLQRDSDEFITSLNQWRFSLLTSMNRLHRSVLESLDHGVSIKDAVDDLEGLHRLLGDSIDDHSKIVEQFEATFAELDSQLSRHSIDDARFARKLFRKAVDGLEKNNDAREKYRSAVKLVLADIDPEARGGPSFSSADDLMRFLHSSVS